MGKKILGIVGSYRRGGVIDTVVSEVLEAGEAGGAKVEKVLLLDRRIEFCTNCRRCTQVEGAQPGRCVQDDDMPGLSAAIEHADALVLGAPVNFGGVNALTQRFLERLVCYAWWPWGAAAPHHRRAGQRNKEVVLVTSSAMPATMARFCTSAMKGLKKGADVVGARAVASIYVGYAAGAAGRQPDAHVRGQARKAGIELALT